MLNMLQMESVSLNQINNDILLTHALMRQGGDLTHFCVVLWPFANMPTGIRVYTNTE